ncbi:MAG: thymidine phosphorylase, partial [Candidatus Aenigmarchaeota archaeon]|nr:thymidine phosphorylase [Candidatus Aenigmarchaeota archaeon]
MNLKAKFMDFEAGLPFVVMNILDAKELGVYVNDRVTLSHGKTKKTAYIETTKHLVKTGEIGI